MADDAPRAWLRVRSDRLLDGEREHAFLRLRQVVTSIEGADGRVSEEGTWDFVERPRGRDAVLVVVHRDRGGGPEVLLRSGVRVPIALGRPHAPRGPGRHPAPMLDELVAGLLEPLEDTVDGRRERARIEVEEEAGLAVPLGAITPLGAPLWVSPGVLPEVLHVFAADATHATPIPARGDGSPFETIAATRWTPLDEAIAGASEGEGVADLRAEVGLRRLAARLGRGSR